MLPFDASSLLQLSSGVLLPGSTLTLNMRGDLICLQGCYTAVLRSSGSDTLADNRVGCTATTAAIVAMSSDN